MSHSPCLIDVRSAAATLPARRWADIVDEEWALPAIVPRTPPDELPALPGEGQVSYQLPAVSETTETWLPAKSTVMDTAPRSAPDFSSFQSFSSVDSGGTAGLFRSAWPGRQRCMLHRAHGGGADTARRVPGARLWDEQLKRQVQGREPHICTA